MPTFIVTSRKKELLRREAESIVIGSRSSATLALEDPLVADEHCAVRYTPTGFVIEDLRTSTGTFVNGRAAEEGTPIRDGDEIVIGVSRLRVQGDPADPRAVTIDLRERGFHYDAKRDPLEWSQTEVQFGHFSPVRIGTGIGAAGVLVVVLLCAVGAVRNRLLEPGPVIQAHQPAALLAAGYSESGCEACHDSFRGATTRKCAQCHEDLLRDDRHPFHADPQSWPIDCSSCHTDHQGLDARMLARPARESCVGLCHERRAQLTTPRGEAPPGRTVRIRYETFSHADHLGREDRSPMPCEACHREAATPIPASVTSPRREYGGVTFEICMECHDLDEGDRHPDQRPYWPEYSFFEATWHGSEDASNCRQCHLQLHQAELVETLASEGGRLEYRYRPRAHLEEFENPECAQCHARSEIVTLRLTSAFHHATHLSTTSADAGVPARSLSEQCLECHVEQRESENLTSGAYLGPPRESCQRCHVGLQGQDLTPEVQATAGTEGRRIEFPHARHVGRGAEGSLESGCLSCHFFGGDKGSVAASLETREDARSCSPCHEYHADIGGGSCGVCHLDDDPVYSHGSVERLWPGSIPFRHHGRGHAEPTQAGECTLCHVGTEKAITVSGVPIPTESSPPCRDCHIREQARFHWR